MGYQLIETIEVGSGGAASIEFTGIPQDGVDLVCVFSERHSTDGNTRLTFNGSSSGYQQIRLYGTGTSASTDTYSGVFIYAEDQGASTTANTFGSAQVYVSNYTSSVAKSVSVELVTENNATAADQYLIAGSWSGTAITSLSVAASSGFVQYSTASLYKITAD
tara:strand:+ start:710 stop:1198 length:489 start_codon:yes stop_codon:yes gene_type:complete